MPSTLAKPSTTSATSTTATLSKKVLKALKHMHRHQLEDLLDNAYGYGCYDEDDDDALRELVQRGLRAGSILEADVLELG